MTGSHEVRGSIPLDSTNIFHSLWQPTRLLFLFLHINKRAKLIVIYINAGFADYFVVLIHLKFWLAFIGPISLSEFLVIY